MQLDFKQLCELLAAFDRTEIAELSLKSADFELMVRKNLSGTASRSLDSSTVPELAPVVTPSSTLVIKTPEVESSHPSGVTTGLAPTLTPPVDKRWVEVKSPMVGTFYRPPRQVKPLLWKLAIAFLWVKRFVRLKR